MSLGKAIEALNPPQGVKNWFGYKKDFDAAGRPKYTFDGERFYIVFQSWTLSRLVSTSERQWKTFADDPNWASIFGDVLTGLRYKELNLDAEMEKRLRERARDLEESLIKRGVLRRYVTGYRKKDDQAAY